MKNKTILILGGIPTKLNETDGMILRELAIDKIFSEFDKIYIEKIFYKSFFLSPFRWLKCKFNKYENKYENLTNNPKLYKIILKKDFYKLCLTADKIYVHSLYFLKLIPEKYIEKFKEKIIVDAHGCVVEEFILCNTKQKTIDKYQKAESFAFPKVNTIISVTENMIEFYKQKYPNIKTNFIKLPIFTTNDYHCKKEIKEKLSLIYSGGTQKWQKIDLLTEIIAKITDKFDITILTPDVDIFKNTLGDLSNKITIKTVPSNQLDKEYQKADLGFILRDDIIVNKVACPTKIIEYLTYGIIPVILQPNIGDFEKLGYSYINYENLINDSLPTMEELESMRENNYRVIEELKKSQEKGKQELLKIMCS